MKRILLALVGGLALAGSANAVTLGFDCVAAGSTQACTVGEASLSVDVLDTAAGKVTLTFSNSDPGTSSLIALFVDDSGLIRKAVLSGGTGTDFKSGGRPSDLPGAGSAFDADFAKKPKDVNGATGGESVSIVLKLKGGVTFADVLAALADGSLKIGAHINDADPSCVGSNPGPQCVGDPGSASFVNLLPVPEPGATALAGVACLGLALIGRRRS
jgi:hypothetical protein